MKTAAMPRLHVNRLESTPESRSLAGFHVAREEGS